MAVEVIEGGKGTHIIREPYGLSAIKTLCGRVVRGRKIVDRPMTATCATCRGIHVHRSLS